MNNIFQKLNLKNQTQIVVLNSPDSFEPELSALRDVAIVRSLQGRSDIEFSLAFLTKQEELFSHAKAIAVRARGDAIIWFAYPKQTSKKYKSEINRDTGWNILGKLGFECVRGVAIDDDWSGARFRRVEFIQKMTRDKTRALSAEGKVRLSKKS
jgi:hypothetical protein